MLVHIIPSHKQFTSQYIPHPTHTSHRTLVGISGSESKLGQATIVASCQGCSGDVYPWIKIAWTQTSGYSAPQMHAYKTPQSHPYMRAGFSKLHILAGRDNKGERSFQDLNLFLSLEFSDFQSRIQCPWTHFPNRTSLSKSSHPGIKEKPPHLTPDRKRLQILTDICMLCPWTGQLASGNNVDVLLMAVGM